MRKDKDTMKKIVFAAFAFAILGSSAAVSFYPQAALADPSGDGGGGSGH